MQKLFPDAEILEEKLLWTTKSIIALRRAEGEQMSRERKQEEAELMERVIFRSVGAAVRQVQKG